VNPDPAIPGWYGKLPGLGDFASRRLPVEFIGTWDTWLQEMLVATRAALGEGWLDCYLTTPIWRFVLLPGLVGPTGWAGVLMPSVDRVGRQFPLTVAVALPSHGAVAHAVFEDADWFEGLEEAALAMLDPTRGPDDLDHALSDRGVTPPPASDLDGSVGVIHRLPSVDALKLVAEGEALRAWGLHAGWTGLWWTRGRVDDDPLMLACTGLPTAEEFGWLLQGRSSPAPGAGAAGLERRALPAPPRARCSSRMLKTRRLLKRSRCEAAPRAHARRTFCTLSVRSRAPSLRMGLFQQPASPGVPPRGAV
jgi:type VI secretion system protein ImpM